uniref:NADH-ubiquinone oxidoreductase chain 5 n=1 Tax=Callitettix biformis TaxID=1245211 RepID=A0A096VHX4_9HEMI|nr:NADH dehydrogenase subunit 5 [Callitettix biformis]AFV32134.1 NADH dehydrogenase subunit 5 [Callitettix biformis]
MNYKFSIGFYMFLVLMVFSLLFFFVSIYLIISDSMFLFEWLIISINSNCIYMSFIFDWMSMVFMSFVLGISSLVICYSMEYMYYDVNSKRFMFLVFLFILSMMFLIISPNLVSILLGWDGLGLVSYCLVIYYQNNSSFNAGMLTALSNRVGDVMLLVSIAWMMNFGSWHYFFYLEKLGEFYMFIFVIIIASFTKSAQLPFSSWLPAAMAAPTPVSALVHSSTLVTAGVYLLIRFDFLICNFYFVDFFIIISLLTMLMASICANFEFDLSKIIALSTLSQLGFMMSVLMLGFSTMAFFHLLIHALFSALLFLCSGVVIHCMWGNQDIRFMGNLIIQMPIISSCMNISNLALCGFPFLSGFYSKDLIIDMINMSMLNFFFFFFLMISIGLTVMYSFRLSYYSMSCDMNSFCYLSVFDDSKNMKVSILFMVFFSVFGGSFMSWLIFKTPMLVCLPLNLSMSTIFFVLFGGWLGYELSLFNFSFINYYSLSVFFMGSMWFLPIFFTSFINKVFFSFNLLYYSILDQGWGEYIGPMGLSNFIVYIFKYNQFVQINNFSIYMLSFFFWLVFILFMFN